MENAWQMLCRDSMMIYTRGETTFTLHSSHWSQLLVLNMGTCWHDSYEKKRECEEVESESWPSSLTICLNNCLHSWIFCSWLIAQCPQIFKLLCNILHLLSCSLCIVVIMKEVLLHLNLSFCVGSSHYSQWQITSKMLCGTFFLKCRRSGNEFPMLSKQVSSGPFIMTYLDCSFN